MKIAIIGTGISGLVAGHLLAREHHVTVYEANDYVGGHTNTIGIDIADRHYEVDTGFIVYNERTYPNFVRLLDELGVPSKPTTMSFSVKCAASGLEYSTRSIFAQRSNLVRPRFYRMLADVLRFQREAKVLLESTGDELELGNYLARGGYSSEFVQKHIIPMGAAIWSTDPQAMLRFPARYFVRFFDNHGLLGLTEQPVWRVIVGGSNRYIAPLTRSYADRIRLRCPVLSLRRHRDHVEVTSARGGVERFDHAVLATHSDQALSLLADPSEREREILGALTYQPNEAVLHTDTSVLPRRRHAWAAWNYHILDRPGPIAVTYNMNILQQLDAPAQFCVTLNRSDAIAPELVLRRFRYHHPLFTPAAIAAQQRCHEINGVNRTFYCGAYWGSGFHEDGVVSAMKAAALVHRGAAAGRHSAPSRPRLRPPRFLPEHSVEAASRP